MQFFQFVFYLWRYTCFNNEYFLLKLYSNSLFETGLVFGIVIGENSKANQWVYAIAGGMFIYVSVCNMVSSIKILKIFLLAQIYYFFNVKDA